MAGKSASLFSFPKKARGADVGTGASIVEPQNEKRLTIFDVGEGVKIPAPTTDAQGQYADAWKEFEKLQTYAKGGGALAWVHWGWGWIPGIVSLFDRHIQTKRFERALFVAIVALGVFTAVRARWASTQLAHWPCPRCSAEWPGKKLEKDPRCPICGLKLGQLAA